MRPEYRLEILNKQVAETKESINSTKHVIAIHRNESVTDQRRRWEHLREVDRLARCNENNERQLELLNKQIQQLT